MNEVARYSPESNSFQSLLTNRPLLGCLAGLGAGRGMSGARAMINLPEQTDFLSVGEGALPCIIARRDRIAIAGASPRPRRARSGGGAGCCCSTVVIVDAHVNVADVASFGRRPPRPLPIPSKMVFGFSRSVDESYPPRRHSRPRRGARAGGHAGAERVKRRYNRRPKEGIGLPMVQQKSTPPSAPCGLLPLSLCCLFQFILARRPINHRRFD